MMFDLRYFTLCDVFLEHNCLTDLEEYLYLEMLIEKSERKKQLGVEEGWQTVRTR